MVHTARAHGPIGRPIRASRAERASPYDPEPGLLLVRAGALQGSDRRRQRYREIE